MDYEDELKAGVLFINQVAKKYSWRCLWWKKS